MLWNVVRALFSQPARLTTYPGRLLFPIRPLTSASRPAAPSEVDEETARQWLSEFSPGSIPRSICDVSFSRSSGPGGQNVNKVNSKATLRVPLQDVLQLVPRALHPTIQASRYHAVKSDAIVIQADGSRKQSENVEQCFQKLHDMILEAGKQALPGRTLQSQKDRVKNLKKKENEARLRGKKSHSSIKSQRKGGSGRDY